MRELTKKGSPFSGCGIVGAFAFGNRPISKIIKPNNFEKMVESIHHRGPEAKGIWPPKGSDKPIMLGHTRLSILDLSERGNQPMTRDHLTIALNGEIYNFEEVRSELKGDYKFTSHTDTEVVLRAYQKWGADALHKFNGMFAFAIWDDKKKSLFLARDRIGIKPIYYYKDDKVLLFGSEVRALMHSGYIPAKINFQVVYHQILINSYFHHDHNRTPIANVYSIPPGHFLIVKPDGHFELTEYWGLPKDKYDETDEFEKTALKLQELFEDSIRFRLVSDVPVAAFLSGGLDSSMINAVAAQNLKNEKLTAITVAYTGGSKDKYSGKKNADLEYSRTVAKYFDYKNKIDHRIIEVDPADISLASIDSIIDLASFQDDERLLTIQRNYQTVKDQGFKVVLNGQGADELMAGYIAVDYIRNCFFDIQRPDEENLIRNAFPYLSIAGKNEKFLNDELLRRKDDVYENLLHQFKFYPGTPMEKAHRFFVKTDLQGILKLEDYLSMQSSVECRLPFLDHRIIEWAFKIPFHKHANVEKMRGKVMLRKAARVYFKRWMFRFLPAVIEKRLQAYEFFDHKIVKRPKQPFPVAEQERILNELSRLYREHHQELRRSEIIKRIWNKDFLKLPNPQISSQELWLLIALWRWEEKLKTFR